LEDPDDDAEFEVVAAASGAAFTGTSGGAEGAAGLEGAALADEAGADGGASLLGVPPELCGGEGASAAPLFSAGLAPKSSASLGRSWALAAVGIAAARKIAAVSLMQTPEPDSSRLAF